MLSRKMKKLLSPEARMVLTNQNGFFELKFFSQVLKDEYSKIDYQIQITEIDILADNGIFLSTPDEFLKYLEIQIEELQNLIDQFSLLMDKFLKYFGKMGEYSDFKGLIKVAKQISLLLHRVYLWTFYARNTKGVNSISNLIQFFAHYSDDLITLLKELPNRLDRECAIIDERLEHGEENINVTLNFDVTINEEYSNKVEQEFKALRAFYKYT